MQTIKETNELELLLKKFLTKKVACSIELQSIVAERYGLSSMPQVQFTDEQVNIWSSYLCKNQLLKELWSENTTENTIKIGVILGLIGDIYYLFENCFN